ncbi:hypothetical protein PPERSA_06778 [Pseudocohnilembus persalinus]|uniref:Uncharacterized protein n=1 Tax=Pseudocohnilembus persalinus TaxID=266149 RepID=A0A0V0QTA4_PSEPJ|nr:hypothetical protein PPERSA_06778 [Pseudocohnilembus persalinus]|eukprot:KRX05144.1 hypothetical protein PPERSA_06778 [Pseudocohnilembus persalinus]
MDHAELGFKLINEESVIARQIQQRRLLQIEQNQNKQLLHMTGLGWYSFKLYKNNEVQTGRYFKKLYDLPLRLKSPSDPSKIMRQSVKIDFEVGTFNYDRNQIRSQRQHYDQILELTIRNRRQNQNPNQQLKDYHYKNGDNMLVNYDKDNLYEYPEELIPFFESNQSKINEQEFNTKNRNNGIDIYIDGMNGLPDNVTICKIEASVIDPNMNEWMDKQDILPNFNEGSNFNPILHDKIELRLRGNEQKENLEKLPCSTVLLRINKAPTTKNSGKVLSIYDDIPEDEWVKYGLWRPRPEFRPNVYNTSYCGPLTQVQNDLYIEKIKRKQISQNKALGLMMNQVNQITQEQGREWVESHLVHNKNTEYINLNYFAKYCPRLGFQVSVDSINKIQLDEQLFYVECIYLQPPDKNGYLLFLIKHADAQQINDQHQDFGFSILPIFLKGGYFNSGQFNLPIVMGKLNENIINGLQQQNPINFINMMIQEKQTYFHNVTSLLIRVRDYQREFKSIYPVSEFTSQLNSNFQMVANCLGSSEFT